MPASTIDGRPVQIWMAEDNAADTLLMREALNAQPFRYELRVFEDGEDALQLVDSIGNDNERACPDLLVLDIHLPKVDGPEVLQRFRTHRDCVRTPVLILSSKITPAEQQAFEQYPPIFLQEKPLLLDEYLAIGQRIKGILSDADSSSC